MTPDCTDCLAIGAAASAGADALSTSAITAAMRRPDLGLDFLGLQ